MLGKTHITLGLGLGALSATAFSVMTHTTFNALDLSIFYGAVTLGALLPDIDEPNSTIGKKTLGISNAIKTFCGHRGLTHSLIFIALLGVLLMFICAFLGESLREIPLISSYVEVTNLQGDNIEIFAFGLVLGCIFHLIGDMLTISGVPLLLPFSTNTYHIFPPFLRFKTGSVWDYAVGGAGALIFGALNLQFFGI